MDLTFLFHPAAIPDTRLPVHGNTYLGPVKSNVDYNYKPVQRVKVQQQKTSYVTMDMDHYFPIENGGI
jgi:hypothetical protein